MPGRRRHHRARRITTAGAVLIVRNFTVAQCARIRTRRPARGIGCAICGRRSTARRRRQPLARRARAAAGQQRRRTRMAASSVRVAARTVPRGAMCACGEQCGVPRCCCSRPQRNWGVPRICHFHVCICDAEVQKPRRVALAELRVRKAQPAVAAARRRVVGRRHPQRRRGNQRRSGMLLCVAKTRMRACGRLFRISDV